MLIHCVYVAVISDVLDVVGIVGCLLSVVVDGCVLWCLNGVHPLTSRGVLLLTVVLRIVLL